MAANLVDVKFLATFFRVDVRTIQLWAKRWAVAFALVKSGRGEYDFVKCVDCRIKDLEEDVEKAKLGDETKYELDRQLLKLKIEEKEIELERQKNLSIDVNMVEIAWKSEVHKFKKSVTALPARIATRVPDQSTYEERYTIAEDETKEALKQLSEMDVIGDEYKEIVEAEKLENENNKSEVKTE